MPGTVRGGTQREAKVRVFAALCASPTRRHGCCVQQMVERLHHTLGRISMEVVP